MMIREARADVNRAKEVKVKIPVHHHIKLHSMKVLTGKQISDAITEALDAYFAERGGAAGMPDLTDPRLLTADDL